MSILSLAAYFLSNYNSSYIHLFSIRVNPIYIKYFMCICLVHWKGITIALFLSFAFVNNDILDTNISLSNLLHALHTALFPHIASSCLPYTGSSYRHTRTASQYMQVHRRTVCTGAVHVPSTLSKARDEPCQLTILNCV